MYLPGFSEISNIQLIFKDILYGDDCKTVIIGATTSDGFHVQF